MLELPISQLALIIGLGIGAQWVAWRLRAPSILFLLVMGWIAGPLMGWLDPDALFGDLLMPMVSLSVALILFEGGLTLQIRELESIGKATWRLVSVGALVTWGVASVAARLFLDFEWPMALLLGSILVVTGPTVIGPLLRQIRPTGNAGSILKWEGIVIDPIGAVLAVLVFEVITHGVDGSAFGIVVEGILKTIVIGGGLGFLFAGAFLFMLRRYWIPEYLQNGVAFAFVIVAFVLSNNLQHESGLLTTTVMGVYLANQRKVLVNHVIEFKEHLRVLLLSSLFVLLAARLDFDYVKAIDWKAVIFVASLILLARPLSVFISTFGTKVNFREKLFLSWMAPRGIVAAAIASVFSLHMHEAGYAQAHLMVPVVFLVIAVTVLLYGLTGGIVARRLGIAEANAQGLVIAGAHPLAREMGEVLNGLGIPVLLLDSNWRNVTTARQQGLTAHYGNLLTEKILDNLELGTMGNFLALTPNDQVNSLASLHFGEVFEREHIFQLAPRGGDEEHALPRHLRGRTAFGPDLPYESLYEVVDKGGAVKSTRITEEFSYADYLEVNEAWCVPLFYITAGGLLKVITEKGEVPAAGSKVISLLLPKDAKKA